MDQDVIEYDVLAHVMHVLTETCPNAELDSATNIFEVGLADSLIFADIILHVEEHTPTNFHHELLDFDGPITPLKMAQAFTP